MVRCSLWSSEYLQFGFPAFWGFCRILCPEGPGFSFWGYWKPPMEAIPGGNHHEFTRSPQHIAWNSKHPMNVPMDFIMSPRDPQRDKEDTHSTSARYLHPVRKLYRPRSINSPNNLWGGWPWSQSTDKKTEAPEFRTRICSIQICLSLESVLYYSIKPQIHVYSTTENQNDTQSPLWISLAHREVFGSIPSIEYEMDRPNTITQTKGTAEFGILLAF